MLLLKYINDNTVYEVEFIRNSENLVTVKGNLPSKNVGFILNRSLNYEDNWDYSAYKTVYRVLEDGFQFSNDGSVWVAPPAPKFIISFVAYNGEIEGVASQEVKDFSEVKMPTVKPYDNYEFEGWSEELPTSGEVTSSKTIYANMTYIEPLESVIANKVSELNNIQQEVINAGTDVTLSDGTVEHFTATANDQISLMGLQAQIAMGLEQIPWHTADHAEGCKYYSAEDMNKIVLGVAGYVTYHVTFFRDLRRYVESLTDKDAVMAVEYDIKSLPQEMWSEVLVDIISKMN